jgi:hypothetical protein
MYIDFRSNLTNSLSPVDKPRKLIIKDDSFLKIMYFEVGKNAVLDL